MTILGESRSKIKAVYEYMHFNVFERHKPSKDIEIHGKITYSVIIQIKIQMCSSVVDAIL